MHFPHSFFQIKYWIIAIFLCGLILRIQNIGTYPFNFDQIQIAENAKNIAHGHPTLIGPRTGPADMFTGPLIYYIGALFTFISAPGLVTAWTAVGIAAITGATLIFLLRRYTSAEQTLIVITLWAFSPFIVSLDRVPWNPNLTLLASSLAFFPFLKKSKVQFLDIFFISVGTFLGYQAHFSGLLLFPFVFAGLLYLRKKQNFPLYYFLLPILAFAASFLPTILFDLRHDWTNYKGFTHLVENKDSVSTYLIGSRLEEKLYIIIETIGKVLFYSNTTALVLTSGAALLGIFVWKFLKKEATAVRLVLFWLGAVAITFSLYRSSTPEYYFLILLPVVLYLVGKVVQIAPTQYRALFILVFAVYSSWLVIKNPAAQTGFTVAHQQEIENFIVTTHAAHPISEIRYDSNPIDALGIRYIMNSHSLNLQENGPIVHVIYPTENKSYLSARVGQDIGIWVDQSTPNHTRAFFVADQLIEIPENWTVLQNISSKSGAAADLSIFDESSKQVSQVLLLKKSDQREAFSQAVQENEAMQAGKQIPVKQPTTDDQRYIRVDTEHEVAAIFTISKPFDITALSNISINNKR